MLIGSGEVKVEKQGRFKLPSDFVRQWADADAWREPSSKATGRTHVQRRRALRGRCYLKP